MLGAIRGSFAHTRSSATAARSCSRTGQEQQAARVTKSLYGLARTVVVNTRKYDIHHRYVAHVFYACNNRGIESTFLKGRYLNQELIDKGHAKPI